MPAPLDSEQIDELADPGPLLSVRGCLVLSRRAFVLGGSVAGGAAAAGGIAAVAAGVVPGKGRLGGLINHCDAGFPTGAEPGRVTRGRFLSTARGREVGWLVALPPGHTSAAGLPLVLVLHGRGGSAASAVDEVHLDRHLAALGRPVALAAVDGNDSYWHPRTGGDDPLGMLIHELVPLVGADATRLGALGWSMGGYGALNLARESAAGRLGDVRFKAVAALSPALFRNSDDATRGAFDGPDDFYRWGALADDPGTGTIAVRVECGASDPFAPMTRRYMERADPRPAGGITGGCHDNAFWQRAAPAALAHLANHL